MKVSGLAFVPPGVTTYVRHSAIVMQNGQQVVCEYFLNVVRFELGSSGHMPGNLLYLHRQRIIGVIGAKEISLGMFQRSMFKVPARQRVPMVKGPEVALVSAVVLETDISRRNHTVESAPQPALEKGSSVRNQQHQGKKIG